MQSSPYSLISELEKAQGSSGAKPPIHLWNPDVTKDIDMEIKADGTWFYLGTPIKRPRLVKLFASVMKIEQGDYYLVTPVEKCRIKVEDAPFMVILLDTEQGAQRHSCLHLTTNVGDTVAVGREHPLRISVDDQTQEPSVYVMLRDGLEAKLNRNVYYQMVELLEEVEIEGEPWYALRSQGEIFPFLKASDLS